jgi:hypothetical protein
VYFVRDKESCRGVFVRFSCTASSGFAFTIQNLGDDIPVESELFARVKAIYDSKDSLDLTLQNKVLY